MLLRIIDNATLDTNTEDTINIVLELNGKKSNFISEPFASPVTKNFRSALESYFKYYIQDGNFKDFDMTEKLIKIGQYTADKLLGEDHQLIKFKDDIEDNGYENLRVQIESNRVDFFVELWENMIFHDSKYILSTVAKSFVRQFSYENDQHEYAELRYDLKVPQHPLPGIENFLNGTGTSSQENIATVENKPLNILYLISRPKMLNLPCNSSDVVNLSLDAITAGGAINYDILQTTTLGQLTEKLSDKTSPRHIFHYDGPIIFDNGRANVALENADGSTELLDLDELCKSLVENKTAVLSVNSCLYLKDEKPISAANGLALIARSAHEYGLGNVIGLSHITDAWTGRRCFENVYSQISRGLSLEQAVVEARKFLQSEINTSLTTVEPIPYHAWSLLVHYSKQSITFFEASQTQNSADYSKVTEFFREKLFGFRSEMLPPLLDQVGDGEVLNVINKFNIAREMDDGQIILLIGEEGSGKSQLAHLICLYFSQKSVIDYGFYFDFSSDEYSLDNILEMIAPVLSLEINQKDKVKIKLSQLHCCFVFDGITNLSTTDTQSSHSDLNLFIKVLLSQGHKVIATGLRTFGLDFPEIEMPALTLLEQKIIAAHELKQLDLTEEKRAKLHTDDKITALLLAAKGHPWLTKKSIPMTAFCELDELNESIGLIANTSANESKVEKFYTWQWSNLAPIWQKLLLLSAQTRGLLLEMLMIAADQKEPFKPAKELFKQLGDEEAQFSKGLSIWESSGFLTRFPHGRTIDNRCLTFLSAQREAVLGQDAEQLNDYLSQLICEGIRLLAGHVLKQPNQNIANNLLINRRHWVTHFENLWFNKDYRAFIETKRAFDQLLQEAKLLDESKAWSFNLLTRSSESMYEEQSTMEEKLSWLALASNALGVNEASENESFLKGVSYWRAWFDSISVLPDKHELVLFHQVSVFLENIYRHKLDWEMCIVICNKANGIYLKFDAWQSIIHTLKSLAKYYYESGQIEAVLSTENKIINDIPYENAPPGLKIQQMIDVLLARVTRSDTQQAQLLMHELRGLSEAEKFSDMLDHVQSDIHYQDKNYSEALPYYLKTWSQILKSNQYAQIDQIKLRLLKLEEKLGKNYFNEQFDKVLPLGTVKPREYVSSLH